MEYYEDPVQGQAAMAEVRRATGLKMSTNMCVTSFAHIPEALKLKPIDVLLCDHHYFGGFAGCLALGPICKAAGWTMSQHSNNHAGVTMAAMIHLAASIPELTMASDTHYPWLVEGTDIIEGPKLTIQGGKMAVPAGPGLGVTLDHDKLARAHETYVKCGMHGRDDRSLMRGSSRAGRASCCSRAADRIGAGLLSFRPIRASDGEDDVLIWRAAS